MTTSVRPARKGDLAEMSRLFRTILKDLPYYNSLAKWHETRKYSEELLAEKLAHDRFSILVAKDGPGPVAGFCFNHVDDFTVWIDWFGVDATQRHSGVGRDLLEATFETAKRRGAHKVWCDTRSDNEPSKNLLRKVGFVEIALVKDHWYRQDFILWERFL